MPDTKVHKGQSGGRWRALFRDDAGAETVSVAILVPVTLVLLISIVQAGLWWHTVNLCSTAAQNGADAGRMVAGTSADARSAATQFLTHAGARVATDPQVHASVSADRVSVEVSALAIRVVPIPGWDIRVTQRAVAAKEHFTVPGARQ